MENNQVQVFNNVEFGDVRVIMQGEQPWFVGKDVAELLGYEKPSVAITKKVDNEDKCFVMLDIAGFQNGNVLSKGKTRTTIINESGLYSLILSSKLPSAKQFKHWVTSEVLPAIRKEGMYMTTEVAEQAVNDTAAYLAKALRVANDVLEKQKQELKKLTFSNKSLQADKMHLQGTIKETILPTLVRRRTYKTASDYTVTKIAGIFDMKRTLLYQVLVDAGWFKQEFVDHGKYYPTLAAPKGSFYIEQSSYNNCPTEQVRVTEAGLMHIKDLLRTEGYIA